VKFKALFAAFNILVVAAFLLVFLLPIMILGPEYAELFWSQQWPLIFIFVAVLGLLNYYFITNWRFFSSLESQDWAGLTEVLEERVFRKQRFRTYQLRVLINAYVLQGKTEKIEELEQFLRRNRPGIVGRLALPLGIPHVLSGNGERMLEFFGEAAEKTRGITREWTQWILALGHKLQGDLEETRTILRELLQGARDPMVRMISAYLLNASALNEEDTEAAENERSRLQQEYTRRTWQKVVDKKRDNLEVLVLAQLIRNAGEWTFGGAESTG